MDNAKMPPISKEAMLTDFEELNRMVRHYCDLKQNLDAVTKHKFGDLSDPMLEIEAKEIGGIGMVINNRKEIIDTLEFMVNRAYKKMSTTAANVEIAFEQKIYRS